MVKAWNACWIAWTGCSSNCQLLRRARCRCTPYVDYIVNQKTRVLRNWFYSTVYGVSQTSVVLWPLLLRHDARIFVHILYGVQYLNNSFASASLKLFRFAFVSKCTSCNGFSSWIRSYRITVLKAVLIAIDQDPIILASQRHTRPEINQKSARTFGHSYIRTTY